MTDRYALFGQADAIPASRARRRGGRVADGIGMLIDQAAEAFVWWRGVRPTTAGLIENLSVPWLTIVGHDARCNGNARD